MLFRSTTFAVSFGSSFRVFVCQFIIKQHSKSVRVALAMFLCVPPNIISILLNYIICTLKNRSTTGIQQMLVGNLYTSATRPDLRRYLYRLLSPKPNFLFFSFFFLKQRRQHCSRNLRSQLPRQGVQLPAQVSAVDVPPAESGTRRQRLDKLSEETQKRENRMRHPETGCICISICIFPSCFTPLTAVTHSQCSTARELELRKDRARARQYTARPRPWVHCAGTEERTP